MIRVVTFAGLALMLVGTAAAQDSPNLEKNLAPFQGTWRVVKAEIGAWEIEDTSDLAMMIHRSRITFLVNGFKPPLDAQFSLDTGKDIPEISIFDPRGSKTVGNYKFDKDGRLTLCFTESYIYAPKEFRSPPGSRQMLLIFEKAVKTPEELLKEQKAKERPKQ